MTLAQLIHGFFNFLGQTQGELLKTSVEFLIFTIIDYMIISEWTRTKKKELRFLILAFSMLAISKLIGTYFLASFIFTNAPAHFLTLNVADNFFEIIALFLLANAFVYPIVVQKKTRRARFVADRFILLIGISFILSLFVLSIVDLHGGDFDDFWTNTSINVADIVILLYYAGYIIANNKHKLEYKANIVVAFIIYTIGPTIELFNIILYDNMNTSLTVAQQPFPFVSLLIFTQVIYLKLVDKAALQYRLKESEQKYEHEKEVSKLKDAFMSTVSHELKTPITSMKLYVGLLKEGTLGQINTKQKDSLRIINEETDRLNTLITDILELSRLESGKAKLNLTEFNIRKLVDDLSYIIDNAKKKEITTIIDVPQLTVTADKDKLKQVIINLFNNAVKFTKEHGTITISIRSQDEHWELSVADTGIGIEKELIPKMFERFYQAENYMTRTSGGVGLGLSIVKEIVELHKGKILVESEVGIGTTIRINFPKLTRY